MNKKELKGMQKLYECELCADIKKTTKKNHEALKFDCGLEVCPYKDEFEKSQDDKDNKIKELLKNFLIN